MMSREYVSHHEGKKQVLWSWLITRVQSEPHAYIMTNDKVSNFRGDLWNTGCVSKHYWMSAKFSRGSLFFRGRVTEITKNWAEICFDV